MLKHIRFPGLGRVRQRPLAAALIATVAALAAVTVACKPGNEGAPSGSRQTSAAVSTPRNASGDPYQITFSVGGPAAQIGAIQFEVRPTSEQGGFAAEGTKARCESLVGEALAAFSTHPDGKLVGALVDVGGFESPTAVARCTYLSPQAVSADAFTLSVTDASDIQAIALAPTPSLVISEVKRVE